MKKFEKIFATATKYLGIMSVGAGIALLIEYGFHRDTVLLPIVAALDWALSCHMLKTIDEEDCEAIV